jgi:LacI family transcriptional regulator
MDRSKKITIQDVAKYANVSVGTIDRVIHNRGNVSADKKLKVEEAIKKLNFNPNQLARALALGNQYFICTLIPFDPSSQHYWSIPKRGVEQAAGLYKDFGITSESFFYNLFEESSFVEQAKKILERNPSGVILAPLFRQESINFVKKLNERDIPYVFIDADIPEQENLSYIGPDVFRSGYIAGKLLSSVTKEKSNILVLNMVKGFENSAVLERMEKGFREYYRNKGLTNQVQIKILTINSTKKEEVFKEITKYYIKNPDIKGVFVTNSKAYLVSDFHLFHELDIRVVGFDLVQENIDHLNKGGIDYVISQSPMQQGVRAVQTLFELFIYKSIPKKIQYVPLDIIIRENLDFYIDFH